MEYPPLAETVAEAGLQEVDIYIYRLHNTVTQFISTRPIMDLCLATKRRQGSRVDNQWWDQEGLELERMQAASQEAIRTEDEEYMDSTETVTD